MADEKSPDISPLQFLSFIAIVFLLRGIKVAKSCDSKSNKVTFYQFDQIKCV